MTFKARFPGTCAACGQRFSAGADIDWAKGRAARHATPALCAAALASLATPTPSPVLELKPVADFIRAARDRGLKAPKLRVLAPDGQTEMRLGLTRLGKAPGSISVVLGETYIGSIRPSGQVVGELADRLDIQARLVRVSYDPAAAAKAYAVLMCRCSFCGLALTDDGSVEVGYGPICAKHWGLSHHPRGTSAPQPLTEGVSHDHANL